MERLTAAQVEWGVASSPLEAGASGDSYLVHALPGGTLLGVVDGLGHGHAAAAASREAIRLLAGAESEHPLAALRLCHEGLRSTRGVVLTLAWIDAAGESMTWLAVGNVQGVLLRGRPGALPLQETLVGRGGVVGRQLPPLQARVVPVARGDLLILATDGIHPRFAQDVVGSDPPQQVADAILAGYRTGADDALVLAASVRGASA